MRVLTEDGHDRAMYYLTGTESLAVGDVAAQLAVALERAVKPVHVSSEGMQQTLRSAGLSEWFIEGVLEQFAVIAGGFAVDATEGVCRLTGREPRRFLEFARDSRAELG